MKGTAVDNPVETKPEAATAIEVASPPAVATATKAVAEPKPAKAKPARKAKTKARGRKPAAAVVAKTKVKTRRVIKARRPANLGTLPGADKFQTLFADAGERSQDIVRKSQKAAEDLAEIAKANVEALTEAGRIATSGARTIGQDALASGREGIEQASAAVKTLAEAKSPTEFFQLQSELARASFDRVVAEGSKFTEQLVKLAGEAVQPLSTRASLNAERINELTA
jgi:phasin family protein